jgi:hypothetical protein
MARTRLPAIPRARFGSADQQRQSDAMQTLAETLSGRRGSGLDRAVLVRDLADAGLVNLKSIGGNVSIGGGKPPIWDDTPGSSGEFNFPPEPVNLQVFGAFTAIALTWDNADYVRASTAAHTEIWRNDVNYFYWIRHVNVNEDGVSKKGSYSASVNGTTSNDISNIIEDLAEQMVSSELIAALLSDIDTTITDGDRLISDNLTAINQQLTAADTAMQLAINAANLAIERGDKAAQDALNDAKAELDRVDELLKESVAIVDEKYADKTTELSAEVHDLVISTMDRFAIIAQTIKHLNASYSTITDSATAATNAKITETHKVLATADEAMATAILNLSTDYKTADEALSAEILDVETTQSKATETLATKVTSIETSYKSADTALDTRVTNAITSLTTADEATASRVTALEGMVTDNDLNIAGAFKEMEELILTKDQAMANKVDTVETSYKSADAALDTRVTNAITSLSNADSAIVTKVSQVETAYKAADVSANAAISRVETSVANTNSSVAALETKLRSEFKAGDKTVDAAVKSLATTSANADNAISRRINSVESSLGNTTAKVNSLATTTANADKVAAIRLDAVESSVNSVKSSVSSNSSAISTLNKDGSTAHKALWSVKANAAGVKAGIGLIAKSDGTSEVAVAANRFLVFDPNNTRNLTPLFAVSKGKVVIPKALIEEATIQVLDAQIITADKIVAGASITSPIIKGGTIDCGSNFSVDVSGNVDIRGRLVSQSGSIYSSNYIKDRRGWKLHPNGRGEFNDLVGAKGQLMHSKQLWFGTRDLHYSNSWRQLSLGFHDIGMPVSAWVIGDTHSFSIHGGVVRGTGIHTYSSNVRNCWWGIEVSRVVPVTKWHGPHTLHAELILWYQGAYKMTSLKAEVKVYRV